AAGTGAPSTDRDLALAQSTKMISWTYLRGAERELAQVLALAGKRNTIELKGSEATTARLLAELPRARWAYLATHGFLADKGVRSVLQLGVADYLRGLHGERIGVAGRNPLLLSGLVLAGANRKSKESGETWAADGGIVLANDLLGLRLEGLRLAVLSA